MTTQLLGPLAYEVSGEGPLVVCIPGIADLRSSYRLRRVHTPALVVMGELDPDLSTPQDEAGWIVDRLGGSVVMVPEAGHYPHSQCPDVVVPAVTSFLFSVTHRA